VRWTENSDPDRDFEVVFERQGDGAYVITRTADAEEPISGVLFVPVPDTPEEDYVAQLRLNKSEPAVVFAFLWRTEDGFRVVSAPGGLLPGDDLSAADPYCSWQSYQGCTIARREDVFSVYRVLIYPNFVTGGLTPESYLDLAPLDGQPSRPPKGRR
jgi:hypothetical protein